MQVSLPRSEMSVLDAIGHDLMNSLSVIKVALDLEIEEKGDDINLHIALKNVNRVIDLIKEYSAMESQGSVSKAELQQLDMTQALERIFAEYAKISKKKKRALSKGKVIAP